MRKPFEETKFIIGIPYGHDHVPIQFVDSLLKLEKPPNCEILFLGNTITSAARNLIVGRALKHEADYVFFLDSDMVIPPNTIRKLWEHDKPITSGLYMKRNGRSYFAFFYSKDTHVFCNAKFINFSKELIEVDGAGTGCLLISCDVFKQLNRPWFFYDDGSDVNLEAYEKIVNDSKQIFGVFAAKQDLEEVDEKVHNGYGRGDDLNFFKQCYENGIKCHIDTSVFCGHVGTFVYGDTGLKVVRLPENNKPPDK